MGAAPTRLEINDSELMKGQVSWNKCGTSYLELMWDKLLGNNEGTSYLELMWDKLLGISVGQLTWN